MHPFRRSVVAVLLIALTSAAAFAGEPPNPIDRLFDKEGSFWKRTDAVMVLQKGQVVYERYAHGYGPEMRHLSWSMAKTVMGILVGVAVDRGYLKLEDPVRKFFPDFKGTATVKDVLQMSSGIDYLEEYAGVPVSADVVRMLYLDGPKTGFGDYVASRPLRKGMEPGKHFYYSTGDTALVSEILRRAMPKKVYDAFPWDALFKPLGIPGVVFERDAKGAFAGGSYVYATAREFARMGELLANRGVYGGKRIIPEKFFELMTVVAPGVQVAAIEATEYRAAYSANARTNLPIEGRGCGSEHKDLPLDAIWMQGHQGQVVAASPSTKLVIVRLATDRGASDARGKLFTATRAFLKSRGDRSIDASLPTDHRSCITTIQQVRRYIEANRPTPISEFKKAPALIRQLGAKEYCSCLFVVGRTEAQCRADVKQTLPILPTFEVDRERKRVVAGKGGESVAVYDGARFGCRLTTSVVSLR